MVLDPITKTSIIAAAREIDLEGVPKDNQWAEYWIKVSGREYQFKHLVRRAYLLAAGHPIDENKFTSSPYTRGYISSKFGFETYFKMPDNVPFFTQKELNFFSDHAGKSYRKESKADVTAGNIIKSSIFRKTNAWVRLLNLQGFDVEIDERWQLGGYFKRYSWARLFKPKYRKHKVFFTLGVNSKHQSLVMKIDCQRSAYDKDKALSETEVEAFQGVVEGTGADWRRISFDEVPEYDWERLYQETLSFIRYYESLYEEAVFAVKNADQAITNQSSLLDEVPPPKKAYDSLSEKSYSFKGVTIDYDALNTAISQLGKSGEDLVISHEQEKLRQAGRSDLAEKVEKMLDGNGYDILSYNPDGSEKYIEVKTTSGEILRPFFLSDNEWAFMKKHPESYHLYRVFKYNRAVGKAKFFSLHGDIEDKVLIRNRQFEVFLKSSIE
jgi:hypothetical protein